MNIKTLKIITKLRGLTQAEIARKAGVSRQAVSLWFKGSDVNVKSHHLQKLATELHLTADDLLQPLSYDSADDVRRLGATLLWDHLYPTIEDFVIALLQKKPQALARLVEVYGLFRASALVKKAVWKLFPKYKKFLPPIRRKQCERIWFLKTNPDLI